MSTWGRCCWGGKPGAAGCLPRWTKTWAWAGARGLCSWTQDCWALAKRLGPTRSLGQGCREKALGNTRHLCHLRKSGVSGQEVSSRLGTLGSGRADSPRPPPWAPSLGSSLQLDSTSSPSSGQRPPTCRGTESQDTGPLGLPYIFLVRGALNPMVYLTGYRGALHDTHGSENDLCPSPDGKASHYPISQAHPGSHLCPGR